MLPYNCPGLFARAFYLLKALQGAVNKGFLLKKYFLQPESYKFMFRWEGVLEKGFIQKKSKSLKL